MYEKLVSELKEESCKVTFNSQEEECESQEEACLEVDSMHEIIEDAFNVEAIKDCYEGKFIQVKEIAEELKKKVKHREEEVERKAEVEREEESELEDCASESDWENSEDENEYEYGESLGKLFDGQLCI